MGPEVNDLIKMLSSVFKPIIQEVVSEEIAAIKQAPRAEQKASKECLTAGEVEQYYGLNKGSLANLRCQGRGPAYFKDGRTILYRRTDIDDYIKAGRVRTHDQRN